jgi:hypothetical protein
MKSAVRISLAIFACAFAIAWARGDQVLAGDNPKFIRGMGLRKAEELVRKAGWMKRVMPYCMAMSGSRFEDCAPTFSDEFLFEVPDFVGTATGRSWLYTCYWDGYGKTLTLTFLFNENFVTTAEDAEKLLESQRKQNAEKLLASLSLAHWKIEKTERCTYGPSKSDD